MLGDFWDVVLGERGRIELSLRSKGWEEMGTVKLWACSVGIWGWVCEYEGVGFGNRKGLPPWGGLGGLGLFSAVAV